MHLSAMRAPCFGASDGLYPQRVGGARSAPAKLGRWNEAVRTMRAHDLSQLSEDTEECEAVRASIGPCVIYAMQDGAPLLMYHACVGTCGMLINTCARESSRARERERALFSQEVQCARMLAL